MRVVGTAPAPRSARRAHSRRLPPPPARRHPAPLSSAQVIGLADQIVALNLLQVSDLTELLKQKLGIQVGACAGACEAEGAGGSLTLVAHSVAAAL